MARKLFYWIEDNGRNEFSAEEWENVRRLQRWYNSEFFWTAGKLNFSPYSVFPNIEIQSGSPDALLKRIRERREELRSKGMSEMSIVNALEKEQLVLVRRGGYREGSLASGFTRVADNEYNAYLVCEFLLKASLILPRAEISCCDEGRFIQWKDIRFVRGSVFLTVSKAEDASSAKQKIARRHVFALVDPRKYDRHPYYRTAIDDFQKLDAEERKQVVRYWNWLGYGNPDAVWSEEHAGIDLNKRVEQFGIEFVAT